MAKSAKKKTDGNKPNTNAIASNRRAFFDYEILDRREAGLVLTGTEIKSVRLGKVDLREAYARPLNGELWLMNVHIATYDPVYQRLISAIDLHEVSSSFAMERIKSTTVLPVRYAPS